MKQACQNSNFRHCYQQITAHYGFHAFLTLQCLFNVEKIRQIFTYSEKLHDSFDDLKDQTLILQLRRERHLKHICGTLQNHSIDTGFHF